MLVDELVHAGCLWRQTFHLGTGLWLIYLTFAATLNTASGMELPL